MSLLLFVALAGYLIASRINPSAVIGLILVGIVVRLFRQSTFFLRHPFFVFGPPNIKNIKNGSDSRWFCAKADYYQYISSEKVLIMEWKRDWNLTGRKWLMMFLLFILYFVFMTELLAFGAGYWLIVLLAFGMGLVQYFFSDKPVLWSTGARILEENEYPELHRTVERFFTEKDLIRAKDVIMQCPVPNTFVTGRHHKHAVIACTDSIMRLLTRDELKSSACPRTGSCKNPDI